MSGDCKIKNDLLITHRYANFIEYDDDEDNNEEEFTEFVVNKLYQCQVIITNISPNDSQLTLLHQIPDGSLPMNGSKYVESREMNVSPYTSEMHKIVFYFPASGTFAHQSSYISENLQVIAKSEPKEIKVGGKRIITNVSTFSDLMKTTQGDDAKKAAILDLLKNQQEKV